MREERITMPLMRSSIRSKRQVKQAAMVGSNLYEHLYNVNNVNKYKPTRINQYITFSRA